MRGLPESRFSQYISVLKGKREGAAVSRRRKPQGYVQIDVSGNRGRLTVQLKNLKSLEQVGEDFPQLYELWLHSIGRGRRKPVKIGTLQVDSQGDGEGCWEFNAENVKGTGLKIDAFSQVLLVRAGNTAKNRQIIMTGDLELHIAESFDGLNIEKVEPFGTAMPNHHWWKFYPSHFFNEGEAEEAYKPKADNPGKKTEKPFYPPGLETGPVFRGHQLIGLHYDADGTVDYLVHGIPGRFCAEDQPDGGSSGYVYWQPLPGQKYEKGHYGYWLVHIDPESGEVVFPKKQTIPPDKQETGKNEEGS